jgi:hypothetical protein
MYIYMIVQLVNKIYEIKYLFYVARPLLMQTNNTAVFSP